MKTYIIGFQAEYISYILVFDKKMELKLCLQKMMMFWLQLLEKS